MGSERIKVKICGMREPENIMQVASLNPDYMGFIFYSRSPRYVGESFSPPPGLPSSIQKTGVFVNESTENIIRVAQRTRISVLQLHGNETVDQCAGLKEKGYRVVKVFSIDDAFDFSISYPYKGSVDFFLFDTKGKYYGGNAMTFNWEVLLRYDQEVPFFLSGGLSVENIGQVESLAGMNLHAVDLNSGVETVPGMKSMEKVEAIMEILLKD